MALAADGEGFVPAEGGTHDLIVLGEDICHSLEYLDCRGRGGEAGAQVGIGIDHNAVGLDLAGHICYLLCALGDHSIGIVLVELLHGDESA